MNLPKFLSPLLLIWLFTCSDCRTPLSVEVFVSWHRWHLSFRSLQAPVPKDILVHHDVLPPPLFLLCSFGFWLLQHHLSLVPQQLPVTLDVAFSFLSSCFPSLIFLAQQLPVVFKVPLYFLSSWFPSRHWLVTSLRI